MSLIWRSRVLRFLNGISTGKQAQIAYNNADLFLPISTPQ